MKETYAAALSLAFSNNIYVYKSGRKPSVRISFYEPHTLHSRKPAALKGRRREEEEEKEYRRREKECRVYNMQKGRGGRIFFFFFQEEAAGRPQRAFNRGRVSSTSEFLSGGDNVDNIKVKKLSFFFCRRLYTIYIIVYIYRSRWENQAIY